MRVNIKRLSVVESIDGIEWTNAQLSRRRAVWQPRPIVHLRGYPRLYIDHVLQADEGCDFDFLREDSRFFSPKVRRQTRLLWASMGPVDRRDAAEWAPGRGDDVGRLRTRKTGPEPALRQQVNCLESGFPLGPPLPAPPS